MYFRKSLLLLFFISLFSTLQATPLNDNSNKKLAYIVSDIKIPFWKIMSNGIKNIANQSGYTLEIYDSQNSSKKELEMTVKAINDKVSGIIVSPSNSSACVTILKLAKSANIPVVIADVGTDSGEFVAYISSKNKQGAYDIGQLLAKKMVTQNLQESSVGIIAIPQKRLNGQQRTAGFMKAMEESDIKGADIKQLETWSDEETYQYTKEMITKCPNLRAIWLQTSNIYKGAINALNDMNKQNEITLITFDAEPIFLELIPKGVIIGSAMQQPYLMGQESAKAMISYLFGNNVQQNIQIPILIVSTENINSLLPIINQNVLGIEKKQ